MTIVAVETPAEVTLNSVLPAILPALTIAINLPLKRVGIFCNSLLTIIFCSVANRHYLIKFNNYKYINLTRLGCPVFNLHLRPIVLTWS